MTLRITRVDDPRGTVLKVDGMPRAAELDELRRACARPTAGLTLDLTGLRHADEAAISLLRSLGAAGARLINCPPYLALRLAGCGSSLAPSQPGSSGFGPGAAMDTPDDRGPAPEQAAQVSMAVERELRRIAAELHDTAIQQLVLARILIDQAGEPGVQDPIGRARSALDDALLQLRSLILGLTPAVPCQAGLCGAIRWLCVHLQTRWHLAYRFRVRGERAQLPDPVNECLFRGARELMTNAGRHAGANACAVVLAFRSDSVTLSVSDDGRGIDAKAARPLRREAGGFGLQSLRLHLVELGGELRLAPRPGGGTRATLRLPRPQPAPGPGPVREPEQRIRARGQPTIITNPREERPTHATRS